MLAATHDCASECPNLFKSRHTGIMPTLPSYILAEHTRLSAELYAMSERLEVLRADIAVR